MASDMAEPAGGTHGYREEITAADEGGRVQFLRIGGELDLATANGSGDGVGAATKVRRTRDNLPLPAGPSSGSMSPAPGSVRGGGGRSRARDHCRSAQPASGTGAWSALAG